MTRERIHLTGRYVVVDAPFMREKAGRNDPRNIFYRALLSSDTYEEYLAKVGAIAVEVKSYASKPITGRMEIIYCRYRGWIEDAG